MSGHSKWHNTRLKKEKVDQVRGKLFSKLAREIAVAAKEGGGDPDGNPRLRTAIDHAREAGMPNDNIQRAIQRGAGGAEVRPSKPLPMRGTRPEESPCWWRSSPTTEIVLPARCGACLPGTEGR